MASGQGSQQGKAGSATAYLCCNTRAWGQNTNLRQMWGERGGGKEIQHHRNQVEGMKGKSGKSQAGPLHPHLTQTHLGIFVQRAREYVGHIPTSGAQAPYVWLAAHDRDMGMLAKRWFGKETSSTWDTSEEAERTVL